MFFRLVLSCGLVLRACLVELGCSWGLPAAAMKASTVFLCFVCSVVGRSLGGPPFSIRYWATYFFAPLRWDAAVVVGFLGLAVGLGLLLPFSRSESRVLLTGFARTSSSLAALRGCIFYGGAALHLGESSPG